MINRFHPRSTAASLHDQQISSMINSLSLDDQHISYMINSLSLDDQHISYMIGVLIMHDVLQNYVTMKVIVITKTDTTLLDIVQGMTDTKLLAKSRILWAA